MIVTPSQTVGPYFRIGLIRDAFVIDAPSQLTQATLTQGEGRVIEIQGAMLDGAGLPVTDGMLEIWDAARRAFGRFETHPSTGAFQIQTIHPRSVVQPNGSTQAPHLAVGVFARGLLKRLYTRIYFADHPGNSIDPILALVPAERRRTLIATPTDEAGEHFTLDIRLSGPGETAFFEC